MRKRLLALSLCVGMVAIAMTGCGKNSDKDKGKDTEEKVTKAEFTFKREDYFGVEVEESVATITDEELQKYIESDLKANGTSEEIKEGVLEKGTIVKVDYKGMVDNKEYVNEKDSKIKLEGDQFAIEGFTDGLIGKSVGDEVKLNLKFPEKFADEAYAGKDIEFTVKIKAIIKETIPELTDEYVKKTYSYLNISTVEEYKEEYRKTIRSQEIYTAIWEDIVGKIDVKSYDSKDLKEMTTKVAEQKEAAMEQYGMKLDDYLEAASISKADFDKQCQDTAKEQLKYEMVRDYIAKEENITVSDEEYNVELKKTMVAYDIETEEEFYEYFAELGYGKEFFEENFLMNKVVDFVIENVVVVPDKEEETEDETKETETKENETKAE